jgi:hypothetical protein
MAKHQKVHETNDNLVDTVCSSLGIHSFNRMTASEYPVYEFYRNQKKELSHGKIYNHDLLF